MTGKVILSAVLLLGFVSAAYAAEGKMEQGTMIEGTVESVSGDLLRLKTSGGAAVVKVVKETKVVMGMNGPAAAKEDIQAGDFLMISGRKLESGEFAADEIMIHRKMQMPGGDTGKMHGRI